MTPWRARRLRRLLALWGPLVVIGVASFVIALLVWRHIESTESQVERFQRAWTNDDNDVAEQIAWKMVRANPSSVHWWLRFIDAHSDVVDGKETSEISEPAIRAQLAKVADRNMSAIDSYWYALRMSPGEPDPAAVLPLANANPPVPFANYVLAEGAREKKDWRTAALRYEREAFASSEVSEVSLYRTLRSWMELKNWEEFRRRIRDPRYASAVDASVHLYLAVHDRDLLRALLWLWPSSYTDVSLWPVALALIAATLWFWIATRLGRIHDAERGRAMLYVTSFVLGVLSVYPTLLTITIEEDVFNLQQLHRLVPDFIYFTFGVGLREEAWKTILFLPLLPALLRRGSRIEAMTCGALVGLGFAAEENISYFEHGADAALGRFLTANFLHMSLTALVALAAFDTLRKRATSRDAFNVVFPLAVIIHGAYDFFLEADDMPLSSIFSIVLLVVIARRFLRQLLIASSREEERDVLNLFVAAMATINGAAFIYATTLGGPVQAFRMIALGTVSVAVMIIIFVRELSPS